MKVINFFLKKIKFLIFKIFQNLNIKIYTKKQRRILKNKIIKSKSKSNSIIFFTTHKCASNFSQFMLKEIEANTNYTLFDYGSLLGSLTYELDLKFDFEDYLNKNHSKLFQSKGEIYGPQRKPLKFDGLDDYDKIFFLRDPRDVLISAYYSFGFSHPEPKNSNILDYFNLERDQIQKMSLDEYVLKQLANWVKPMYQEYIQIKEASKGKVLFVSYSEYINASKYFFDKIFNFFNLNNQSLINKLIEKSDPIQQNEDITKHQRSGREKQWIEKLEYDTLRKINSELYEILLYWGFETIESFK